MDSNNLSNPNENKNPYGNQNGNQNPYDSQIPEGYRNSPSYQPRSAEQRMASTALFLGIASICTCWTVYVPFVLSSLAVILALLSKGAMKKMLGQAKTAIVLAAGGLALVIGMISITVITFISNPTILRDTMKQYDQYYEQMYGESTEDAMGISFEDMVNQMLETD